MSWIHLINPDAADINSAFGRAVHPQALNNATCVRHFRDRVFSYLHDHDGYLFGELAVPARDELPSEFEVVGLRVFADHQRVVTAFCRPIQMPDDFDLPDFDHLLATSAEEEWSSGEVLWHLLDTLTAEIHAQLDEAQLLVGDIENFLKTSAEAIKDHETFRNELSTLRRLFNDVSETVPSLIAVCEAIGSDQLDLRAAAKDTELFPRELEIYVMDVLVRLRAARSRGRYGLEEVDVLQDSYSAALDRQQVKAGNRMAGVANMLLWPTLVVGFYGMNIDPDYFGEMSYLNGPILAAMLLSLVLLLYRVERRRW